MGREYFLAGIGGCRPQLTYSPVEDRCAVQLPGHEAVIAMLPSNTVDAVFTSRGVLTYRDSKGEIRAIQIPDHEPIYAAAVAAIHKEDKKYHNSLVTGTPFSQIMGRHTGGMVSDASGCSRLSGDELSGHGPYRSEGTRENMDDVVNRIVIGKDACMKDGSGNNMRTGNEISNATIIDAHIAKLNSTKITAGTITVASIHAGNISSKDDFEKFTAALVREHIAPLVKNVQRLTALNAELASRVKEMEKLLADKQTARPVAAAPSQDSPIREVSWGDQGGLPNFLHPQDNPFCGKRRG